MSTLFILQNQQGYFLKKVCADKNSEWIDGREPQLVFHTQHKDEAINMLVETNSQDITLRIRVKECKINAKHHWINHNPN